MKKWIWPIVTGIIVLLIGGVVAHSNSLAWHAIGTANKAKATSEGASSKVKHIVELLTGLSEKVEKVRTENRDDHKELDRKIEARHYSP
jgi:hypothetical protein